jgi:hypothetical protein
VLSSLNTLYKHKGYKILLCGDGNLVRLLPPGHSHLSPDRALEGPSCGLISLGSPATASSTGLQWNLGMSHNLHLLLTMQSKYLIAASVCCAPEMSAENIAPLPVQIYDSAGGLLLGLAHLKVFSCPTCYVEGGTENTSL